MIVPLSPPDAIAPALRRTRSFLFRPFRLGTFFKLSLVALITEGLGGNFHTSWPHGETTHRVSTISTLPSAAWGPGSLTDLTPGWIAAMAALVVASILIALVLFYLVTRLRFAYFHCLLHNTREIRPGWRLYRSQARRFFWMNLAVGLCFFLFVALLALLFASQIWRVFRDSAGHPAVGPMLALIFPGMLVILLIVAIAIALDLILRDFLLPHYALENASAGQAWEAAWLRIRSEPAAFAGYGLLRIFLPMVAWIAIFLILILPTVFTVAAVALVEIGIHAAMAHASGALPAEGVALQIAIGAVATTLTVLVWIGASGPLSTAVREYALLFYGGRYRPLGDALTQAEVKGPAPEMA